MRNYISKLVFGIAVLFTISAYMYQNVTVESEGSHESLLLSNLVTLNQAYAEGGTSETWTCYSNVNNCWFWGCWTTYRCGNPCETVSTDEVGASGKCTAI